MWGLMVWVYAWLAQMLWRVRPEAWLFLVIITIFNKPSQESPAFTPGEEWRVRSMGLG